MIILDVPYVFRIAGGPGALRVLLEKHDGRPAPPSYATVQMWHQRQTIPSRWVAPVLYAMHREGHDMLSLFTDTELTNGAKRRPRPAPEDEAEDDIFG